tara:strand:- start:4688 stop:5047 length:360 start_codon:yes stop_codon:yes gene_type:complete
MGEIVLTPFEILFKAIRKEMRIQKHQILSRDRTRDVCEARQMFCLLARMHTKKTTGEIGEAIKRDHSTVVYATKNMQGLVAVSKRLSITRNYIELDIKDKLRERTYVKICEHCKQIIHE